MISEPVNVGDARGARIPWLLAGLFFSVTMATSYARWRNFEYRTFDLAYYVQGIWQSLHGRFDVSIEHVPLLGNHVEPIVLLFAPLFAVLRHPLIFVAGQNAALALMCPVGYGIARRLGFSCVPSICLAAALLLAPATGYIALHEFHPEAFTALFLLLMIEAWLRGSTSRHWIWFSAVLACKENMALLLAAYCMVGAIAERKRGVAYVRSFYLVPLVVTAFWFVLCTKVITPALNSGSIDYLALYERLGSSAGEILRNAIWEPHRILRALGTALTRGNLLTGTLLPFLCLPLLRPRWLLVAAPVLLQHLLSWRSSEWMIYFHYAAPLVPLFWFAGLEGVAEMRKWRHGPRLASLAPSLMLLSCCAGQSLLGPAGDVWRTASAWNAQAGDRTAKAALVAAIPPAASVLAPLPYLSHLAMRENCYSLHYILKGLKTLSRAAYELPPPTDYVLIDYGDAATFDASAGYYHPKMQTTAGRVVPSSDRLLYEFLRRGSWKDRSIDEFLLLKKMSAIESPTASLPDLSSAIQVGPHNLLVSMGKSAEHVEEGQSLIVAMSWVVDRDREVFPWLELAFTQEPRGERLLLTKGLCAVEVEEGPRAENWEISPLRLPAPGIYHLEARFMDNTKRAWAQSNLGNDHAEVLLCPAIELGSLTITARQRAQKP